MTDRKMESIHHGDATGSRAADPRKAANGDWLRSAMLEVPVPLESGGRAIILLPPDGSFTMDDAKRMGAALHAWVTDA